MSAFRIAAVLRVGATTVLRGTWGEIPAIAKVVAPVAPWVDPGSAFYGGQGLAPPFRPLLLHEAEAWRRVDADRVLAAGPGPGGLWLVLREQAGEALSDRHDPDATLVGLLEAIALLHARDVVHRDVRPANVLVADGRVRLLDLDGCRSGGLGAIGPVAARAWRAPETWSGEGDGRQDLYAVGRVATALGRGSRPDLVAALCAPDPAHRPPSAMEALATLGCPAPPPALSAPHPWATAWWTFPELDAAAIVDDPWELVRTADRGEPSSARLAGAAVRLLARAPRGGAEAWLALGALCWRLHALTGNDLYRAQAEEALHLARAGWHPAAGALAALLAGEVREAARTEALCAVQLAWTALDEAVEARQPGRIARAAWALGLTGQLDAALRGAGDADPLAASVAASRLLRTAPDHTPAEVAAMALPADQLEAVRWLVAAGDLPAAERLAAALPGTQSTRASLILALARGRREEAKAVARTLASGGRWDPTIAALLVDDPEDTLREAARELLTHALPAAPRRRDASAAVGRLGGDPDGPIPWLLAIEALAGEGRLGDAATAVGLAGSDHGPTPWRILFATLLCAGELESAEVVRAEAERRFPGDVVLGMLAAGLSAVQGDAAAAERALGLAIAEAPNLPEVWLVRAILERAQGRSGERALRTAAALGAAPELVAWIRLVGRSSRVN